MTTTIYYKSPLLQFSVNENGNKEYHIHVRNYIHNMQAYRDNTNKHLIRVIRDSMLKEYNNVIKYYGVDTDNDTGQYIYIHIPLEGPGFL